MAKINQQMVCINCDEVFDSGYICPVCASRQVYPLGRWIRQTKEVEPVVTETVFQSGCAEMVATWVH